MSTLISDIQALLESHRQMNRNYHGRPDCKNCSLMEDIEGLLELQAPVTLPAKPLFDKLCGILGHQSLKYTPARAAKLRRRLKTFSEQEIITAAKAIADNEYLMGDNPSGKKYGTVDYLIRNDEKLDEWLESARGNGGSVDLRSIEI